MWADGNVESGLTTMHQQKKQVHNLTTADMTVVIEPHGDVLSLEPGQAIEIVAQGTQEGEIELVSRDAQTLSVYTWPTSTCAVYQEGRIIREYSVPVPGIPIGMTTRSFLDFMLGTKREGSDE
jgi:hypothetical protein